MGHLHDGFLLGHKKEEKFTFATVWMDVENIILTEISQRKTNTLSFTHVESNEQTELTSKVETES